MKIIIDTMGSDKGMEVIVKGTLDAMAEKDFYPIFCGPEEELVKFIPKELIENDKIAIINAEDVIENTDEAALAIRRKKNHLWSKVLEV